MPAGLIPGLPPIKHIAAGRQHAVLSDGERVWVIGKWTDDHGKVGGCAPWQSPLVRGKGGGGGRVYVMMGRRGRRKGVCGMGGR